MRAVVYCQKTEEKIGREHIPPFVSFPFDEKTFIIIKERKKPFSVIFGHI